MKGLTHKQSRLSWLRIPVFTTPDASTRRPLWLDSVILAPGEPDFTQRSPNQASIVLVSVLGPKLDSVDFVSLLPAGNDNLMMVLKDVALFINSHEFEPCLGFCVHPPNNANIVMPVLSRFFQVGVVVAGNVCG